jgi:hypothetical protein
MSKMKFMIIEHRHDDASEMRVFWGSANGVAQQLSHDSACLEVTTQKG